MLGSKPFWGGIGDVSAYLVTVLVSWWPFNITGATQIDYRYTLI